MTSPALQAEIRQLVDTFASQLEVLIRRAALETVAQALGAPPAPSPARPGRQNVGTALKSTKSTPPAGRAAGRAQAAKAPPAGRVRRTAEAIEATAERIVAHVEQNPGKRAEDIRAALGLARNEWTLTVKRLTESGRVVTKGEKRATVYFTRAVPRFGVVRRSGRAPAATEPSALVNEGA